MIFTINKDQIVFLIKDWDGSFEKAIQEGIKQAQAQFDTQFPTGLEDYLENHYVIANIIEFELSPIDRYINKNGSGELWKIAKDITDAFTQKYKDQKWEGNYHETLQAFVIEHFTKLINE